MAKIFNFNPALAQKRRVSKIEKKEAERLEKRSNDFGDRWLEQVKPKLSVGQHDKT